MNDFFTIEFDIELNQLTCDIFRKADLLCILLLLPLFSTYTTNENEMMRHQHMDLIIPGEGGMLSHRVVLEQKRLIRKTDSSGSVCV